MRIEFMLVLRDRTWTTLTVEAPITLEDEDDYERERFLWLHSDERRFR